VRDPSEDQLDALMARLAVGERDAFDPLFRAVYPRALRLARVKLPEDQATDAAQSILMRVFARASDFEPGKPVLPWFYAIASNELRTLTRRNAALATRHAKGHDGDALVAPDDPERALLEGELRGCLDRAIASLDDASAEAIRCILDERHRPAVAAATFRKRVSRAYARLRILLLRGSDAE
jgi:RNA polymerase sigma-70 factor (ECF subfamily)